MIEYNKGDKISLEEVLEQSEKENSAIFLDSGFFTSRIEDGRGFLDNLYECKRYNDINYDEAEYFLNLMRDSKKLLEFKDLKTTAEVTEEFETFKEKICEMNAHIGELEKMQLSFRKNQRQAKLTKECNPNKELLDEICLETTNIKKVLHAKIFKPSNYELYEKTWKLLDYMAEKIKLKEDNSWKGDVFNPKREARKKDYLKTDEKLTAAAMYNAYYNQMPTKIITMDGHVSSLFNTYMNITKHVNFEKYHEKLIKLLGKNQLIFLYQKDKSIPIFYVNTDKRYANDNQIIKDLCINKTNTPIPREETEYILNGISSNLEHLLANYKEPIIIQENPANREKIDNKIQKEETLEYAHSLQCTSNMPDLIQDSNQITHNSSYNQIY